MAIASCPYCNVHLQITPEFAGRTLQCPNCKGAFIAPGVEPEEISEEDGLPLVVLLTAICGGHLLLFFILAMAKSLGVAIFVTTIVGLAELAIWKRKELLSIIQQSPIYDATRRVRASASSQLNLGADAYQSFQSRSPAENASIEAPPIQGVEQRTTQSPPSPTRSNTTISNSPLIEVVRQFDDALVEIRPAQKAVSTPRTITLVNQPPLRHERPSISPQVGGRPLETVLPRDNIYFYGPGTELNLGRGILKWPLVYATGLAQQGRFDVSLIDSTLPVAPVGTPVRDSLPYWPSYYDCTPPQRAYYLNWLLSGKSDPDAELGYVFIYFYGLERRVLVDRTDYLAIVQELIRLLPIYHASNSFRRYVTALLWLTLYLANEDGLVPQDLLFQAVLATERWNDDLLGMLLAILHNKNQPLPPNLAFLVCQNDPRTSSSVVVRRHQDEFTKLFEAKFQKTFGGGMEMRASKRLKRINYQPASGSLIRGMGAGIGISLPSIPDVLALSSQFKTLLQFWNESVEELKAYSRVSRSSGGVQTADTYESLPVELRKGDHPESDAWMQAWEDHADAEGWPIVPISALFSIKGIPEREKLTKTQCAKLLRTADALGLGVEPDARMTGRNYLWNERVALFFLDEEPSEDNTNYVAASVLLRLGASIAESDGEIGTKELSFITNHLEGQFNLSNADSKRLERLQYLLLHSRSGENSISSALAKRLPRQKRLLIGEFLVGVAAIDEIITEDEVKELRRTYKLLDLSVEDLDQLLAIHATPANSAGSTPHQTNELRLDMQAISRIMTETREVAGILRDAMAEDEEQSESSWESTATAVAEIPISAPTGADLRSIPTTHSDLDARFRPFLAAVLKEDEWTPTQLRELAKSCSVMLSGAVEAINEWSIEKYGDWLIVEGDTYQVQRDLVGENYKNE